MNARSEIRGLLTGLALVAGAVLVSISYDIGLPGQSILQSLRLHLAAACLALPVAFFIFGAWKRGVLMLAVIAVSVGLGLWPIWQLEERRQEHEGRQVLASLDVLSFNVLAFNEESERVAAYLTEHTPDIAVIMETPGIEDHLTQIAAAMPYRAGCQTPRRCDTSILSRLPLEDSEVVPFGPMASERLIRVRVRAGDQPVTIVAAHLSKPYFDGLSNIELAQLKRYLDRIEGPVILSGDFNAALWSDAMAGFATDASLVPPAWPPGTWPTEAGDFGIPIDNMFTRGPAVIGQISGVADPMGSNHRGLRARVDLLAP